MKKLYLALSCGIVALGAAHMAATTRLFPSLTQAALWFLSGGLAMVLTGALNLLNRAYGGAAPGLRWVCVSSNAVLTVFALTAGLVGRASAVELVVVVGLFLGATVLSSAPPTPTARSVSGAG